VKKTYAIATALALVAGLMGVAPAAQAAQGDMIVPASGSITGIVGNHCGKNDTHEGTDIARSSGGPVLAAASGRVLRVIKSTATSGYGTQITIDHGNGYLTRYGHLIVSSPLVAEGQTVSKGQQIASMGNTGGSTGTHLHFEVRINGISQSGLNGYFPCGKSVSAGATIDWSFPGFPSPAAPPAPDADGDGVPDSADACRTIPGFSLYAGCGLPRTANSTDFNGDSRADVFFAHPNGQWWASDGGSSPWRVLAAGNVSMNLFQFADFDGDGKDDVFYPHPNGTWLVSFGGTQPWTQINTAGVAGEELQLGDFNGDGKADVFWANASVGEWWISYSGTGAWKPVNNAVPSTDLRIADFNGDGQDDVFWAHPNGQWWVADSATGRWHVMATAGVQGAQLKFGDLNGDGKADVFWPNPADGFWWVSYGGNTSWSRVVNANVAGEVLQLADLTGDGKTDVFFPNTNAGAWWMSDGGAKSWQAISNTNVAPELLAVR
jgi:hypothetical protein